MTYKCGHDAVDWSAGNPTGQIPCPACKDTITIYETVYTAMLGNIRSLDYLVDKGLISGSGRPSILDLDRIGMRMFRELPAYYRNSLAWYWHSLRDEEVTVHLGDD